MAYLIFNTENDELIDVVESSETEPVTETEPGSEEVVDEGGEKMQYYNLKLIVMPKTEINMMKVDDLRALAKQYGIENADSMTGSAIKEHFVKIFDL